MLYHLGTRVNPVTVFSKAEYIIHIIYFFHLFFHCRIKNIRLYAEIALKRRRLLYNSAMHLYLMYYFLQSKSVGIAVTMNIIMGGYWLEHCRVLEDVNTGLRDAIGL